MVNKARISLDTNVIIFGLRKIDPYATLLLKNLYRFEVHLTFQVEFELRKNLLSNELHLFYVLMEDMPEIYIDYQHPDENIFEMYRQLGLKTGDAMIAAYCEEKSIDILVSENRHFLQKLKNRPFIIMDSRNICQMFGINA